MSSNAADEIDDVVGFWGRDGKWVTKTEVENKLGDQIDASVTEVIESLEDIGLMNVSRNDDGEIIASQLSQFAVDLYDLPEDAPPGRKIGVYFEHDKEPPESVKEEWYEEHERQKEKIQAGEFDAH